MNPTASNVQQQKRVFHKNAKPPALLITRNFPPLVGGMERLNQHIFLELSHTFHMGLVGPRGARSTLKPTHQIWECSVIPLPKFLFCATIKGIQAALRLRPRIVLAGSGLTAPIAYVAAKIVGARLALYLHGLDVEAGHPIYRCLWRPFFRRFDLVIVNSNFTKTLAVNAKVPSQLIVIVHPGVTMPDFKQAKQKRFLFRKRYGLDNDPVMLYVGRITARKGLATFARDIFPRIARRMPKVKLVVIGGTPSLSILNKRNEQQITRDILAANRLKTNALFMGWIDIDSDELDSAYFASDVLIFPVQKRCYDNEGFGMVAIEAAAHGLPTVAFAAGGVPDAVKDGISGRLIPSGDNEAFANAVLEILSHSEKDRWRNSCRKFAENFSWAVFGDRLRRICSEIIAK